MQPVVLITGASGGLGQALVAEFIAQGWRVGAGFHTSNCHSEGGQLLPVGLDVTRVEKARNAVQLLLNRWGQIDALINNAGITADQPCWQIDDSDWERVVQVNLKGAFLCSQAVLRPMMECRQGHILNLASFGALSGPKGQVSYAAAKAGLLGLTEALAREVGSANIQVNAILPGLLPTPMTARLTTRAWAHLEGENVLGRISSLEEVARFTVFLAGLKNISGQLFQLDSRIARWA